VALLYWFLFRPISPFIPTSFLPFAYYLNIIRNLMLNVTPHCITHTVNSCIYARDGICDDPRGKVGSKGNCKVGTDCQVSCPDISFKPPFLSSSYLPTHAPTSTTAYQNKEMSRSVLDFLCPFYSPLPFDLLLSLPYLNNRNHVILS
jgi:hypothetical protein